MPRVATPISRLRFVGGAAVDHVEIAGLDPHPMLGQPSSMGEDANGELYAVDHASGVLVKVVAGP